MLQFEKKEGIIVKKDSIEWIDNLLERIHQCIESRNFRFSKHAVDRGHSRDLSVPDVIHVLLNGRHEKDKTVFNNARQTWNYAVSGKTINGTEARIIVAFEGGMVIITVIRLTKK